MYACMYLCKHAYSHTEMQNMHIYTITTYKLFCTNLLRCTHTHTHTHKRTHNAQTICTNLLTCKLILDRQLRNRSIVLKQSFKITAFPQYQRVCDVAKSLHMYVYVCIYVYIRNQYQSVCDVSKSLDTYMHRCTSKSSEGASTLTSNT
jgi:hypothetical protein